jgi:hypothetical protein
MAAAREEATMKIGLAMVLLIAAIPAYAQSNTGTPQSACASGDPWFLPSAPAKGETSILVVAGATTPLRIRLCNCAAKEDGKTYIWVNPHTTDQTRKVATKSKVETTASITSASQLYVGSCLEAVGNVITIRNTLQKDQKGTYLTRP